MLLCNKSTGRIPLKNCTELCSVNEFPFLKPRTHTHTLNHIYCLLFSQALSCILSSKLHGGDVSHAVWPCWLSTHWLTALKASHFKGKGICLVLFLCSSVLKVHYRYTREHKYSRWASEQNYSSLQVWWASVTFTGVLKGRLYNMAQAGHVYWTVVILVTLGLRLSVK